MAGTSEGHETGLFTIKQREGPTASIILSEAESAQTHLGQGEASLGLLS